ncbi:MAG: hypothetical protein KAS32_26425 [Candidatus Peribacteraceae bacterium]|nr:hypothetical protein [Candidatus Peribacteraceae bacterium]
MAKDTLGDLSNIFSIIVSILVIVVIIWLLMGKFNIFPAQSVITTQTEYTPSQMVDCSYYNIGDEHNNAYGSSVIDKLESNCLSIGGVWTENNREMSCYWNPEITTLDCDSQMIDVLTDFCEDSLLAVYTCDNTIAYAGCHCNRLPPSDWVVEASQDDDYDWGENESYMPVVLCGDVMLPSYGDLGGICSAEGWCPDDTQVCSHYWNFNEKIHECGCTNTFFCGQYCYEYTFSSSGNCECPPNSFTQIIDRSTFQCVPNNCVCNFGQVVC